jgi:hypothetical protein
VDVLNGRSLSVREGEHGSLTINNLIHGQQVQIKKDVNLLTLSFGILVIEWANPFEMSLKLFEKKRSDESGG